MKETVLRQLPVKHCHLSLVTRHRHSVSHMRLPVLTPDRCARTVSKLHTQMPYPALKHHPFHVGLRHNPSRHRDRTDTKRR